MCIFKQQKSSLREPVIFFFAGVVTTSGCDVGVAVGSKVGVTVGLGAAVTEGKGSKDGAGVELSDGVEETVVKGEGEES